MRAPDFTVNKNYLHRWWIIPKNKYFNIYRHVFYRSDIDRALHDHPWYSVSFLIKGELREHSDNKIRYIPRWFPVFRTAKFAHRLEIIKGPVTTFFITGPKVRDWGFHDVKRGWIPEKEFLAEYEKDNGYSVQSTES